MYYPQYFTFSMSRIIRFYDNGDELSTVYWCRRIASQCGLWSFEVVSEVNSPLPFSISALKFNAERTLICLFMTKLICLATQAQSSNVTPSWSCILYAILATSDWYCASRSLDQSVIYVEPYRGSYRPWVMEQVW